MDILVTVIYFDREGFISEGNFHPISYNGIIIRTAVEYSVLHAKGLLTLFCSIALQKVYLCKILLNCAFQGDYRSDVYYYLFNITNT